MTKFFFIRIFALILSLTFVLEASHFLLVKDIASVEIDADSEGEEEEKKEDKLKEFSLQLTSLSPKLLQQGRSDKDLHFLLNWTTPMLDTITPPPEELPVPC